MWLFLLLCTFANAFGIDIKAGTLSMQLNASTGAFELLVAGHLWWSGSRTVARDGGNWYIAGSTGNTGDSKPDLPLVLVNVRKGTAGEDQLGKYEATTTLEWRIGKDSSSKTMLVSYRPYPISDSIVIRQEFPDGLRSGNRNGQLDEIITSALTIENNSEHVRVIAYMGTQLQDTGVVDWPVGEPFAAPSNTESSAGGPYTGSPFLAYNAQLDTIVVGPLDNFFVTNRRPSKKLGGAVACGFSGTIAALPARWAHEFLITAGSGVDSTLLKWGDTLLAAGGGKTRATAEEMQAADTGISHLGYYTDNGAFYYYNTEIMHNNTKEDSCHLDKGNDHTPNNGCYNWQTTISDIRRYLSNVNLPAKYFQFDSWWYQKVSELDQGCDLWEPRGDAFPSGLDPSWLNEPLILHNRWFSDKSRYFKGKMGFEFIDGGNGVLVPNDENFFPYIMGRVKDWGMVTYEQDFLTKTFMSVPQLQSNVSLAYDWLKKMNNAARNLNVSIQYCMAQPQHILQSSAFSNVLSGRASQDYQAGSLRDQWSYFPMNSMLYSSIALVPFKDNFWSTTTQTGNLWGPQCEEPNPQLQALLSALSSGPVGPSDKLQNLNVPLVMQTSRADGLLLRPDRPAVPMDAAFRVAFSEDPRAAVWPVHATSTNANLVTHYILSALRRKPLTIRPADLGCGSCEFFAFEYFAGAAAASAFDVTKVSATSPLVLDAMSNTNTTGAVSFQYFILAPVAPAGYWTLLGEAQKFVASSKQRFYSIRYRESGSEAVMSGAQGERFTLMVLPPKSLSVQYIACTIGNEGSANVHCGFGQASCSCGPSRAFFI